MINSLRVVWFCHEKRRRGYVALKKGEWEDFAPIRSNFQPIMAAIFSPVSRSAGLSW